jgi:hypothetical protein
MILPNDPGRSFLYSWPCYDFITTGTVFENRAEEHPDEGRWYMPINSRPSVHSRKDLSATTSDQRLSQPLLSPGAGFRVLASPPADARVRNVVGALRLKTAPAVHFLTSTRNSVSESSEEGTCQHVLSLGASTLGEEP